jgi:hypothetical protein
MVSDLLEAVYDLIWGVLWLIGRVALEIVCLLAFLGMLHWMRVL